MGKLDIETKKYMQNPEVFADAFNYFLHGGRPVIQPADLREVDSTELALIYGGRPRVPVQKFRDVLKQWVVKKDSKAMYMLLGVEAQGYINYAMPVRNMLYDAMNYSRQAEKAGAELRRSRKIRIRQILKTRVSSDEFLSGFRKEDRLLPVITLVVYFGISAWDGPTSLHEMMEVQDKRILSCVADYKLNLITPADFSVEDAEKLKTDFPLLMESIRNCRSKEAFAAMENRYEELSASGAEILRLATGFHLKAGKKGETTVVMAKGVKEFRDDCIEIGRKEGIEQGIEQGSVQTLAKLVKANSITVELGAETAGLSVEEFRKKAKL